MLDASFASPTLSLRLDSTHCPQSGGRVHLVCEVTAPLLTSELARRPLDLVLVLDASGSMAGEKIEAVKRASVALIARLSPFDRVSLVTFAEDVRVHGHCAAPHSAPCAQLLIELMQLRTRGNTNLAGGWLTGVELAQGAVESGRRPVVLLLSDGQANAGEIDPSKLARFAAQASAQGITTTCIGVGADYSLSQLGAISEAGGSRFHHADTADAIEAVILGELGELETTCLDFADLALSVPPGFAMQPLSLHASHADGDMHIFRLGALLCGTTRRVVVALDAPAAWDGAEQHVHVALHGMRALDGAPVTLGESVCLHWTDRKRVARRAEDTLLVVQQWRAWLERTATGANELGDMGAVRQLLDSHLPSLRAYAHAHPEAEQELAECFRNLERASTPMSAMQCKEEFISARKRGRGERDLR